MTKVFQNLVSIRQKESQLESVRSNRDDELYGDGERTGTEENMESLFFDEDLTAEERNELVDSSNPRLRILKKSNQPKKPKTFQNLISSIIKPSLVTTLDIEFFVYLHQQIL